MSNSNKPLIKQSEFEPRLIIPDRQRTSKTIWVTLQSPDPNYPPQPFKLYAPHYEPVTDQFNSYFWTNIRLTLSERGVIQFGYELVSGPYSVVIPP